jgi:membrane protease YdiL (CAAX protease family)
MVIATRPDGTWWRSRTVAVVAVLVVANVMSNRVLPGWTYIPWNLAIAALIVLLARSEVSMFDMGFARWRRGAAWGGVLFVLTTGALLLALAMPAFHQMYHDRRVQAGVGTWLYQSLIRIPLGTAVLEETAFRAVLPGLFVARNGLWKGCLIASTWFGLWHVLPALHLSHLNPTLTGLLGSGTTGQIAGVVLGVVGTVVAGLWWCWVRYRSGSVLATMIAHVATNSVAYTIAFWVNR